MDFGTLPLALVHSVDRACNRFEAEWRAGRRPVIERFLDESAGPELPMLLGALIVVELEMRRERGESPARDEIRGAIPRMGGRGVRRVRRAEHHPGRRHGDIRPWPLRRSRAVRINRIA
jgi:hypothetical protein